MDDPPEADRRRPGPVYDRAVRMLVATDPASFCRALGVTFEPGDEPVSALSTQFVTGALQDADLLARTPSGRLLHMEFQHRAGPGLALRMLRYRAAIMTAHPGAPLDQVVVVLADGRTDSLDDPRPAGFRLGCRSVHLRDVDPEVLLATPVTAPLAALGRGSVEDRTRAFVRALQVLTAEPGDVATDLVHAASVLATIRLDASIIKKIREEAGMSVESIAEFYEQTEFGQLIHQRARAEGLGQGRAQALEVLLRQRFGDRPEVEQVARRLAAGPDLDAAVRAVATAADLDQLVGDRQSVTGPPESAAR